MGVPSVLPSKTPDQISGTSASSRWVISLRLTGPAAAQVGEQIVDAKVRARPGSRR